jgi:hypothetical protein
MTIAEMKMRNQTRKAEQFCALHVPGKPLVLFNVWDAGSAKAVAAAKSGRCQNPIVRGERVAAYPEQK